jgi:hypothetical protein
LHGVVNGPLTVELGGRQIFHLGDDPAKDVPVEMDYRATIFISESIDRRLWVEPTESQWPT